MCDRPILIDNPYLGLQNVGLNFLHDTTSLKIPVPCGNCPTCISLRQNYFVQRTQMEALNHHLFMLTLTYRQSMIRYLDVNGRRLYYADFTDVQKMFKRLRSRGLKFSYHLVSEYGGRNHRPHFHALLSFPKGPKDNFHDIMNLEYKLQNMFAGEWRRNYGSDRKPIYKPLCQLIISPRGRTFDLHYINPALSKDGEADVAFYVTKYITKSSDWLNRLKCALKLNLPPDKFEEVWKLLKPRCCVSKSWGSPKDPDVIKHIRKGIDFSLALGSQFPFFINPVSGQTFPLSPYYQRRFLTMRDKMSFFYLSTDQEAPDGYKSSADRNVTKEKFTDHKFSKIQHQIDSRLDSFDNFYDYDEKICQLSENELEENFDNSDFIDDSWSDYNSDFQD